MNKRTPPPLGFPSVPRLTFPVSFWSQNGTLVTANLLQPYYGVALNSFSPNQDCSVSFCIINIVIITSTIIVITSIMIILQRGNKQGSFGASLEPTGSFFCQHTFVHTWKVCVFSSSALHIFVCSPRPCHRHHCRRPHHLHHHHFFWRLAAVSRNIGPFLTPSVPYPA